MSYLEIVERVLEERKPRVDELSEREKCLKNALRYLNKQYPLGFYEDLYDCSPELYRELLELEEKVESFFLDSNRSLDEFKAALKEYEYFHVKAFLELENLIFIW
jgi:hypothetical protein